MPSRAEGTARQRSLRGVVRTLVISDLHLGARTGVDLLRRAPVRARLLERLDGVDRLVLLGDTIELRHGPPREALAAAAPVLAELGAAMRGGAVLLVAGNHDHRLLASWLEGRGDGGRPPPLGLEERPGPDATALTKAVAELLAPAEVDVRYPGVWLADDVYATHGHYVDRHSTVPSFERLAAGALGRVLNDRVDAISTPDDYEVVLAPLYALLDAIAVRAPDGRGPSHANASSRAWRALAGDGRRPLRRTLLAGAFPLGVRALNRAGIGPFRADLSGAELRRAGLRAMREVVGRLGIDARHVVFGHTHRAGPLAGDDAADWALPGGGALLNTGSWIHERAWTRDGPGGPYWPGAAVVLEDGGEPRPLRLLDDPAAAALLR
jgi:calcineurin-like phosphoesterase family protein